MWGPWQLLGALCVPERRGCGRAPPPLPSPHSSLPPTWRVPAPPEAHVADPSRPVQMDGSNPSPLGPWGPWVPGKCPWSCQLSLPRRELCQGRTPGLSPRRGLGQGRAVGAPSGPALSVGPAVCSSCCCSTCVSSPCSGCCCSPARRYRPCPPLPAPARGPRAGPRLCFLGQQRWRPRSGRPPRLVTRASAGPPEPLPGARPLPPSVPLSSQASPQPSLHPSWTEAPSHWRLGPSVPLVALAPLSRQAPPACPPPEPLPCGPCCRLAPAAPRSVEVSAACALGPALAPGPCVCGPGVCPHVLAGTAVLRAGVCMSVLGAWRRSVRLVLVHLWLHLGLGLCCPWGNTTDCPF